MRNYKISTVACGTYITIATLKGEYTVRLPNGTKQIARDLEDLANVEVKRANILMKRAERLRSAAADYKLQNSD